MNKLLIGAALSSMFWAGLASAAYQDEVLADGPVAYYRFEGPPQRTPQIQMTVPIRTAS